ncbi:MAG: transcriptional repressor [Candidatus Shapirobacteria bacterium]
MNPCKPLEIIDQLSCRNTKIRFGVISIFHQVKKPISALEVIKLLKENHSTAANKTTVYRQLDFLILKNVLTSIDIEGVTLYELNKNKPHQVLVCSVCHEIFPLTNTFSLSQNQVSKIEMDHNFKIHHYSFLCFGICQKCQK